MSILIKGMKMPKSCDNCRFSGLGGLRNERVVCMFTGANAYMNTVQYLDDCPLVEVPPHGRLIDADAPIPLVDTHGKKIEVTVAHIIENNLGVVNAIIPAEEGE